jgi:hypothetical protein
MGSKAKQQNKSPIITVQFVPSPDADRRLARIYDLLLRNGDKADSMEIAEKINQDSIHDDNH